MSGNVNQPRRRGRPPRTPDTVEVMRGKTAAAAERLFREEGYASVSMRRLAAEVGCAPMTLYAYFESKADILGHLWDGVYAALFADLKALAATLDEPAARLAAISRRYVRYWIENPNTSGWIYLTDGVSQAWVDAFIGGSGTVDRYQLFFDAMRAALGRHDDAMVKRRTEILLVGLQGIAHSHVTISGYPWTKAETMSDDLVSALARP